MHSFIHSFTHSLTHSSSHFLTPSLTHSFPPSCMHSFIHPCIHPFIHPLMHPFIHSFTVLPTLIPHLSVCKPLSTSKHDVLPCRQTVTPSSRYSPPPVSLCLSPSTTQPPTSWQPNMPSSGPCCKCAPNSARAAIQQRLWT